ncbi:MAG: radical SAM protein [Bacteroidales bacterium]|nr:radical SAM protein [Bacteroidales bacterium]MCF8387894.1 radical SAM protein [Bacteroidales bacterium]MCF8399423.1 radical SAM protein [Bacteroidales bacterium]
MRTAYFSMSFDCNEKCIFCPCSEGANTIPDISLDEMKHCLDRAIEETGVEHVLLSGGEPTLKKDLLPFLSYIVSKKLSIGILSNALKFTSERYLDKMLEITGTENLEITTAIHSHIPKKHERLTQLKNSFAKSMQGIQNVYERGVKTTVKYNVINYTYRDLPAYTDWVFESFPDDVTYLICNIDINGVALKNKDMIAVEFSESTPFVEEALDKVIAYRKAGRRRNVKLFTTPLCTIDPYYWGFVNNQTKETLAALRVPTDVPENDRLFLNISSDTGTMFEPCRECAMKDPCPGTWKKTGELFGDKILSPFQ